MDEENSKTKENIITVKRTYQIKTLLFLVAAFGIAFSCWNVWANRPVPPDAALHQRVTGMERGTEKYEVFELLGMPDRSGKQCCLPRREEFKQQFAQAGKSGANEFHCWQNGESHYYCIGFDEHERMLILLQGSLR